MNEILKTLLEFSDVGIAALSIVVALAAVLAAFRAGVLRSIKVGPLEIKASDKKILKTSGVIRELTAPDAEGIPFETEHLASYYAQVLAQSRTSFWFSLVFASIGFLVIVMAAFMHADAEAGSTIARFVAGGIVDAVAALFFVQSNRAQVSMAEFFDKLRRDRHHAEARKLCDSIETKEAKDALRVRLALQYAEVETPDAIAESIMTTCLRRATSDEDAG